MKQTIKTVIDFTKRYGFSISIALLVFFQARSCARDKERAYNQQKMLLQVEEAKNRSITIEAYSKGYLDGYGDGLMKEFMLNDKIRKK
jgi:hypothetical protein